MDSEILARNIKLFRKGKMTQSELAEKIGKSVSAVKKYELGIVEVPNKTVEQIASALGVTISDLYGFGCDDVDAFVKYLDAIGYKLYWDDPEHTPFLFTENGVYSLKFGDLESIKAAASSYLKFTIGELVKEREKIR